MAKEQIRSEAAAAMLGITVMRVHQLARNALLKGEKIGSKWMFNPADVRRHKRGKPGRPKGKKKVVLV